MEKGTKARLWTYLVLSGLLVLAIWLRTGDFTLDDKVLWSNGSVSVTVFDVMFLPAFLVLSYVVSNGLEGVIKFLNSSTLGRTVFIVFVLVGAAGVAHVLGWSTPIDLLGGLFKRVAANGGAAP